MQRQSWEHITETATDESQVRTFKHKVAFHYFNPHGLYARKQAMDAAIDAAVKAGRCKAGAILAHGGLATFHTNQMSKLVQRKHVSRIDYLVWRDMFADHIADGERFVSGITAGPDRPSPAEQLQTAMADHRPQAERPEQAIVAARRRLFPNDHESMRCAFVCAVHAAVFVFGRRAQNLITGSWNPFVPRALRGEMTLRGITRQCAARRQNEERANTIEPEECGCCGYYHRHGWYGDCREDSEGFMYADIDEESLVTHYDANGDGYYSREALAESERQTDSFPAIKGGNSAPVRKAVRAAVSAGNGAAVCW